MDFTVPSHMDGESISVDVGKLRLLLAEISYGFAMSFMHLA